MIKGYAVDVDGAQQRVMLRVVKESNMTGLGAPGVQLNFDQLSGYSRQGAQDMPHAWQAGAQTTLLRRQLQAMLDDGLAITSVPPAPYRCPPLLYERASLIASYFKQAKPKARIPHTG